jgi:hypothetical protein
MFSIRLIQSKEDVLQELKIKYRLGKINYLQFIEQSEKIKKPLIITKEAVNP